MHTYRVLLKYSAIAALLISMVKAADYPEFTVSPLPSGVSRAVFNLWIPEEIKPTDRIRAVLCATAYSASEELFTNADWRAWAPREKVAIMLYDLKRPTEKLNLAKEEPAARAILAALEHYASVTSHPELAYAGIIPTGTSQGGWQAVAFSCWIPDRVICAVPYHESTPVRNPLLNQNPAGWRVPMLHCMGAGDNLSDQINPWVLSARAHRALWGTYLQAGLAHPNPGRAPGEQAFILEWIKHFIDTRVPATVPASPYTLAPVAESSGWLASYEMVAGTKERRLSKTHIDSYSNFSGNKRTAVWFPTEALARRWQTLYSGTKEQ